MHSGITRKTRMLLADMTVQGIAGWGRHYWLMPKKKWIDPVEHDGRCGMHRFM
jgi:hypothetical protein